jgi:hypothetical protein
MNISEENLEQVVGGQFQFDGVANILTYTHKDGSVTYHKLLDAKKAWVMSNQLHAQFMSEDKILKEMIDAKYVQG